MIAKAIQTDTYFSIEEIKKHLQNVEYIIMATPAPSVFKDTPIHFSIFLNTQEELPDDVKDIVLEKFLKENSIINPTKIMSRLMSVGFSMANQDTPMPLLLIKQEDKNSIPSMPMHVIDFLADSDKFFEAKQEGLTGWTYSYNR